MYVNYILSSLTLQAITISGTLGIGLYVQGGQILRLAGPLAVLLSFALLGLLAWAVMQCIAELVCIWPISGALTVFVSEFVDEELGIAVGVAYWYDVIGNRSTADVLGSHIPFLSLP
jgi:amino acid transporter